jgi:hypothetical protein
MKEVVFYYRVGLNTNKKTQEFFSKQSKIEEFVLNNNPVNIIKPICQKVTNLFYSNTVLIKY